MAVYYAEQVTNALAGYVPDADLSSPTRKRFHIVVPTGGYAAASIIVLALIPAAHVVTNGLWFNSAAGAAATGKIQDYLTTDVSGTGLGTDSKWGTLTDMTNATLQRFPTAAAAGYGIAATVDKYLAVLTAAQTIQAGATISGFVDYQ